MAVILLYFTKIRTFGVSYITMVEVRSILSSDIECSPKNLVFGRV